MRFKKRFIIFHSQEPEHVFEQKHLGVILEVDLKFDDDISAKIKKANIKVGLIWVNLLYLDALLFGKLFIAFVRPHLEYSQVNWVQYLKKHVNTLENKSPCATKFLD